MIIGCVKEIKDHEFRVGLTPNDVLEYTQHGHEVWIESGAGDAINFYDADYEAAGAKIADKKGVFERAQMIVKVKEPIECEYEYFRKGQILFTYLHLAADEPLTNMLLEKEITAIAYETIQDGRALPCLAPMSSIAGRLSITQAAKYLEKTYGGNGTLLGGVPGVNKGKVVILGGGVVGLNAAQMAMGLGAEVTILDIDMQRLGYIDQMFGSQITTLYSNAGNVLNAIKDADAVIGSVLIPGAKAPKLVRKEHLAMMKKGAVIVDVAIDQGGCIETSHPTTHTDPIYEIDGIIHYSVANMPGAVAKTATMALVNTTTPWGLRIADLGAEEACRRFAPLALGLNTYAGKITYEGVAQAFGKEYTPALEALK